MSRTPNRPGAVLAVSIILFLAGGLGLVGSVCGGGSIAMMEAMPDMGKVKGQGQADPMAPHRFVKNEVPGYMAFVFGSLALGVVLAIVNIVLGIGILRLSSMARIATILLVVFDLLLLVAGIGFQAALVLPAQMRFVDANPAPEFAMTVPTTIGSLVVSVIFKLAVAITILVLLNTPATKAAFAAAGQPQSDEDDQPRSRYDGYDDDYDSRRSSGETGITDRPM